MKESKQEVAIVIKSSKDLPKLLKDAADLGFDYYYLDSKIGLAMGHMNSSGDWEKLKSLQNEDNDFQIWTKGPEGNV